MLNFDGLECESYQKLMIYIYHVFGIYLGRKAIFDAILERGLFTSFSYLNHRSNGKR